MRYYVTANSWEDKQSLLTTLTGIIDSEPGSKRNILVTAEAIKDLDNDARVSSIQPYSMDWPGFEYRLFAE